MGRVYLGGFQCAAAAAAADFRGSMLQMASEKGLAGEVSTDAGLDNEDLANASQIAKKAETVDATDVIRVDIEYGSSKSSLEEVPEELSEDPIEEVIVHASVTEKEKINNECDINSERASDGVNARLLVVMEPNARRENGVLQKLLRAPRYFDYPESNWPSCNEFCEDGNRGKKDKVRRCYICGDINHSGNRCKKVNVCIICAEKGHLVINCPNKNVEPNSASTPCLKCGNADHNMFSCTNDYDSEDLKAIECYICKEAGHLCCVEKKDERPTEASCYRCGQSGHFGLECTKSNEFTFDLQLFCRKCKERGHSRKQCPKKAKAKSTKKDGAETLAKSANKDGTDTKAKKKRSFYARRRKKPKQTPTDGASSSRPERWRLPPVASPFDGNKSNGQP